MGAKVIEKHFTLDKEMEGPDHFHSAEPEEFRRLCLYRDEIEQIHRSYEYIVFGRNGIIYRR